MAIYKTRLSAPAKGDKFYTHYDNGGINICLKIDQASGFVLPNCVGYAHGRILELRGEKKTNWSLPAGNAEDWVNIATRNKWDGRCGNKPKLGAAIVWSQGAKSNGKDGAGHVAIVEQINSDGSLLVSESGYNSYLFKTETIPANYSRNGMKFEGFVYCGIEFEAPKVEPVAAKKSVEEIAKEVIQGKWGNGAVRKSAITKAGYNYDEVQKKVDELLKKPAKSPDPVPTKQALTATSYKDYVAGAKYEVYRVRTKWGSGGTSIGEYRIWGNAFRAWTKYKDQGYHIFDNAGKQLD